jgi:hypothetical protein
MTLSDTLRDGTALHKENIVRNIIPLYATHEMYCLEGLDLLISVYLIL